MFGRVWQMPRRLAPHIILDVHAYRYWRGLSWSRQEKLSCGLKNKNTIMALLVNKYRNIQKQLVFANNVPATIATSLYKSCDARLQPKIASRTWDCTNMRTDARSQNSQSWESCLGVKTCSNVFDGIKFKMGLQTPSTQELRIWISEASTDSWFWCLTGQIPKPVRFSWCLMLILILYFNVWSRPK